MKCSIKFYLIISLLFSFCIKAQSPCEHPNSNQFDFWVGQWNLTWKNEQSEILTGENTISKILDGCAIEENFIAHTLGFEGKSVSVYFEPQQLWKQTWIDNRGGYLDFTGGMSDDKMILSRKFTNGEGQTIHQRMVWYNINENSLDWNWEKSHDGKNWKIAWKIHYERR